MHRETRRLGIRSADVGDALRRDLEQARDDFERALGAQDVRAADALRVRYATLERRWRIREQSRLDRLRAAPAASGERGPATLNAGLYPIGADTPGAASTGVGVCLSGGGSRAASASMGALRGLRHLGLLDRVAMLSTVSGGGWAGVPFTYLPSEITDDEFLGEVVPDPHDLRWCHGIGQDPARALDVLSDQALGSLCTRIGLVEFLAKAVELSVEHHESPHALWCRAVGSLILEPFGLGDITVTGSPRRYFSWTADWVNTAILGPGRNPGLSAVDFHLVAKPHRPYLITNATVFSPPGIHPRRPTPGSPALSLYPFESTSTAVGVPLDVAGDLGGGWIDPFAFGGPAPIEPPVRDRVVVGTPPRRFALSDIAGTSSSAFVGPLIENFRSHYPWLEGIDPVYPYWPVKPTGGSAAQTYYFGDGGNLENTGIMALLRRRIPRIIAFVNAETPLSWDAAAGQVTVDSQLPPLFGLQPKESGRPYAPYPSSSALVSAAAAPFRNNQVFEPAAFNVLIDQLWKAHQAGGSAICHQTDLTVRDNARFGIYGAGPVDVLWMYNNPVTAFGDRLDDTVKIGMAADPVLYRRFPNYDTIFQLHLTARQVNLLAHLSCWNVINERSIGGFPANAALFRAMFG